MSDHISYHNLIICREKLPLRIHTHNEGSKDIIGDYGDISLELSLYFN